MHNLNNIFKSYHNGLNKIILTSLFSALLGFMLFILYQIYFGSTILCEGGESLYELKISLTAELHSWRINTINYEYLTDTYNQMIARPINERNFTSERTIFHAANRIFVDGRESFNKISEIELRIKTIEPSFRSPLQYLHYPRIGV